MAKCALMILCLTCAAIGFGQELPEGCKELAKNTLSKGIYHGKPYYYAPYYYYYPYHPYYYHYYNYPYRPYYYYYGW